jgi:predicted metal-dependent phosphoesterase TrpH
MCPAMHNDTWSAADLHIHTTASDGVASPEEVLEWVCSGTDLKIIAITDHNTNAGAIVAAELVASKSYPVEVIVGQEVESGDGHILGLWTPERIDPGMPAAETVAAIHAQGGFAIAAHPFAPRFWAKAGLARGSRRVYDAVDYDGMEIANSTPLLFVANLMARFYQRSCGERFACTGGSDAHILPVIGTSRTYFRGETAAELRTALDARTTQVSLPGFSPMRNWRYARHVPRIMANDRVRKAREVEEGIREPKAKRAQRS